MPGPIRQVVCQPEEKLYWQITRVQPVRISIVEAFWSGKKYSTKTWYGDYLFGRDPFRERLDLLMERWARDPLQIAALEQLTPLAGLMRLPPFEADLWKAQNTYYERMSILSSLTPSSFSAEWLASFRALGDYLRIAPAFPQGLECPEDVSWSKSMPHSSTVESIRSNEHVSQ